MSSPLVELSEHRVFRDPEYRQNYSKMKGRTIDSIFVNEGEADYYEIRFTDGTYIRVDSILDMNTINGPVARTVLVFSDYKADERALKPDTRSDSFG